MVDAEGERGGANEAFAGAASSSIGHVTAEKMAEVQDILASEKQAWVDRLKKEVNSVSFVRFLPPLYKDATFPLMLRLASLPFVV